MASFGVDIQLVRNILRDATKDGARFSQRGLSKAAGLDRDGVYDILTGRNKNPSVAVLASLAQELGGDVSMFGLSKTFVVSEEQLRRELAAALPHMPKRAGTAEQAEYLAEAVAAALGLPKSGQGDQPGSHPNGGKPDGDGPPASPKA